MSEHDNDDKHIKCVKCKCKYHNNDESIKDNFGFIRLGETYKCCVKCRNCRAQYQRDNVEKLAHMRHQFWIDNKDTINARRQELIRIADESNGTIKYCYRCYHNKPLMTLYVQMANHITRVIRT